MNSTRPDPHHGQAVRTAGRPLADANAAMILVHGRGATAASILELSPALEALDFAVLAPQAAGHAWYPYSFLEPIAQNEPGLSSGLRVIDGLVERVVEAGISTDRIVLAGFSQGACLAAEYAAQHARRYGGLLVFSGGLIGPPGMARDYPGSLDGTPVFLGCSDRDAHIPRERVEESAAVFRSMGASVEERIYPDMGHTIIQDEIDRARLIVAQVPMSEQR